MRAAGRMEMAEVKRGALFRELRTTTAARQPALVLSPGAVVPSRRELASGRRNLRKAPAVDKVADLMAEVGAEISLSDWLRERGHSEHLPAIYAAMVQSQIPEEGIVPLLAGMSKRELLDFMASCRAEGKKMSPRPRF